MRMNRTTVPAPAHFLAFLSRMEEQIFGKAARHKRQAEPLDSWVAPYLAFVMAVFVCIAAAAAVASFDLPLILGGF